jgi:hypothetical protein
MLMKSSTEESFEFEVEEMFCALKKDIDWLSSEMDSKICKYIQKY